MFKLGFKVFKAVIFISFVFYIINRYGGFLIYRNELNEML